MHIFLNLCTMEDLRFSGKDFETILGEKKKESIQTYPKHGSNMPCHGLFLALFPMILS